MSVYDKWCEIIKYILLNILNYKNCNYWNFMFLIQLNVFQQYRYYFSYLIKFSLTYIRKFKIIIINTCSWNKKRDFLWYSGNKERKQRDNYFYQKWRFCVKDIGGKERFKKYKVVFFHLTRLYWLKIHIAINVLLMRQDAYDCDILLKIIFRINMSLKAPNNPHKHHHTMVRDYRFSNYLTLNVQTTVIGERNLE